MTTRAGDLVLPDKFIGFGRRKKETILDHIITYWNILDNFGQF